MFFRQNSWRRGRGTGRQCWGRRLRELSSTLAGRPVRGGGAEGEDASPLFSSQRRRGWGWPEFSGDSSLARRETRLGGHSLQLSSEPLQATACLRTCVFSSASGVCLSSLQAPLSWVVGHFLRALVSFASQGRSDAAGPGGGFVEIPSSLVVAVPSSWEDGSTRAQLAMREILVGAAALGLPPPVLISKASALLNAWAASHLPSGLRALQELTQKQRQNSEQEREAADPPQVFLAIVDVGFAETSVQILELSEQTAGDEAADAAFSVVPKVLASEADPYLGVSDVRETNNE